MKYNIKMDLTERHYGSNWVHW